MATPTPLERILERNNKGRGGPSKLYYTPILGMCDQGVRKMSESRRGVHNKVFVVYLHSLLMLFISQWTRLTKFNIKSRLGHLNNQVKQIWGNVEKMTLVFLVPAELGRTTWEGEGVYEAGKAAG
jgi:hypothetical protein